ncbi:MAG: small subunit ribosomal protein S17e [Candidatus Methanomethylophilaceae archaeon]|nr:small subunit ribosomal protein S17e [Candidatus Methanomethylophilaceae archaeon]MDI3541419.1 small subunit ribosomal protein S17e [Candidatus Methanomethylophilaceae archaeon]HIJ00788.1 30S ribosomal protein S17e [Candidatus Methanomethylophilaceae archaeon]
MGKIRPTYIKRVALELLEKYPEAFNGDFDEVKKMVNTLTDVRSVSMRNRIAGYIVNYRKQIEA